MCQLAANIIARERQHAHPDKEIIVRPGGPVKQFSNLTAPKVCEIALCDEPATLRCGVFECARYTCKHHGPEHRLHADCELKNRDEEECKIQLVAEAAKPANQSIDCSCGRSYKSKSKASHFKSKFHVKWMTENETAELQEGLNYAHEEQEGAANDGEQQEDDEEQA